jgi:predicted helicase
VYDFDSEALVDRIKKFIATYNSEVHRWETRNDREADLREFLLDDDEQIKWSSSLRRTVKQGKRVTYQPERIRPAHFRPFCEKHLYFDKTLIHRTSRFPKVLPGTDSEEENRFIALRTTSNPKDFHCLASDQIADLHLTGDSQCFPFYVYDEDGSNRRENITNWALEQFQSHYGAPGSSPGQGRPIDKWDLFHYVYAVLHHPHYRERYAGNLKRQLPRIPYAPSLDGFRQFVDAGEQLADLHVGYEEVEPYDLNEVEDDTAEYEWRVEKMKFVNDAQTVLRYNDFLSLKGIPERAHDYCLGNRSALEWLVNQYKVRTYHRYDITHDPNDPSNKWYIVDLMKRVTTVSVETVDIVEDLPSLDLPKD